MKKNSKDETRRKALQAKSRKMKLTVGIDLGDEWSQCCCLGECGEVIEEFRVKTTREALRARFGDLKPMVIALEVGTHSRWVPPRARAIENSQRVGHSPTLFFAGLASPKPGLRWSSGGAAEETGSRPGSRAPGPK